MNDSATERIQGTDGIRGLVKPASQFPGLSPLETFLEKSVITEEFFELYCFAYVSDLIEREKMEPGREILFGWDPRDREGFYTSHAISGVSKAGGKPVLLGVLPTPGVPLLLVNRRAGGAIMITASHNPADQNGIKIFNAPNGMKMLPEEDIRLTARIFDTDYEEVKKAAEKYEPLNVAKTARKVFLDFHMDRRNSWTPEKENLFADTTLIVDPANGALSGIAEEFFSDAGFREVIEVAGGTGGEVNENSGVALLEGIKEINAERLNQKPAIARHELVKRMFEEGRRLKNSSAKKDSRLLGAAFDADGDRFYALVYSAEKESVYVLSGDETAALQAGYLSITDPERWRGAAFVHTIESDINVARHVTSLGFEPLLTPVGDKWILQKAYAESETFGVGCEESGHCISAGVAISGGSATSAGEEVKFFAGNGLKGAINTMVSMLATAGERESAEEFAQRIRNPFEPGFRQSAYSYYVDKKLFVQGSAIWRSVEKVVRETFNANATPELSIENVDMENDTDTLFMKITRGDNEFLGTLFIRNSGTEDKVSVNVRGARELENLLAKTSRSAVLFLMRNMKDKTGSMASAEATILEQLSRGDEPGHENSGTIDFKRLIFEMETKQKLIERKSSGWALTSLGSSLVD